MKRLVSFLFLSLLATIVLAQPQAPDTMWTRTFGGFNSDEGKKVLQTLDGGYIIVGSCGDVYLIKTDANGNEQWERFYGGTGTEYGNSIKITSDGGYIIVGQTQVLSYYVYLLKTDSSGNLLWERQIGNIEDDCSGWDIDLTTDGGYIICGWCYMDTSVNVYTDGFLAKADSLGNLLWYRTYGGNYGDWLISLQVCPDGGFVACGYKTINPPYNDFYLVKTDSLGNTEWERIITGNPSSCAYDVQITNDGGYIFAGAIGIAVNNCDVYLIKTDSLGDEQWHSIIGGTGNDGGESVCETFD
jgi:hypothetical protein